MNDLRVGQGFDAHAFSPGRPLILGGITIPFEQGLAGHSDGDALLHAVVDALLGAAGLGDIGHYFPSDDESFRDANSRAFVVSVVSEIAKQGWQLLNLDATIIAQQPRLSPHLTIMRTEIARLTGVTEDVVNVKATTTDYLGTIGRGDGLAALVVCLLQRRPGALLSTPE